jgi:hypothetical protein
MARTRRLPLGALAVAAAVVAGCGRPATREECQAIFDKTAALELREQNVTDPAIVEERVAAVRAARGEELIARCVGRRVTERALACVAGAETGEQVDRCLQ